MNLPPCTAQTPDRSRLLAGCGNSRECPLIAQRAPCCSDRLIRSNHHRRRFPVRMKSIGRGDDEGEDRTSPAESPSSAARATALPEAIPRLAYSPRKRRRYSGPPSGGDSGSQPLTTHIITTPNQLTFSPEFLKIATDFRGSRISGGDLRSSSIPETSLGDYYPVSPYANRRLDIPFRGDRAFHHFPEIVIRSSAFRRCGMRYGDGAHRNVNADRTTEPAYDTDSGTMIVKHERCDECTATMTTPAR